MLTRNENNQRRFFIVLVWLTFAIPFAQSNPADGRTGAGNMRVKSTVPANQEAHAAGERCVHIACTVGMYIHMHIA